MTKFLLDIILSILILLLIFPVMICIAITIFITMGKPILFVQKRPGRYSTPFNFLKFRTMNNINLNIDNSLSDSERITRIGNFLRKTSLDELPSLLNVIKGEMSLVGPRPLLMEYLPLYSQEQMRRHEIKPGVTGWAQVNGRNTISWEEKFKLDVWYVDNQSFWLDMKIIFLTIWKVLIREGVSPREQLVMRKFRGNN